MARLPLALAGIAATGTLLLAGGSAPAAAPAPDATPEITAQLAIFRAPMRHPQDEIRPIGAALSADDAALAAQRSSRLIADTPQVRIWAALDGSGLRLVSAFKRFDPAFGPPPVGGEAPEPPWTDFFLLRGSAGGTYRHGQVGTRVLLVADGARRARLIRADGTSRRLTIRRNAIVARVLPTDRVVWRDASGRRRG
jgi:hypothetical protein